MISYDFHQQRYHLKQSSIKRKTAESIKNKLKLMLTFIYGDSLKEPPHLSQSLVMNDLVVIEFSVHSAITGTLLINNIDYIS